MQHLGNFRGIVFKRADPSRAGKVKVWVPAVHKEIYQQDIDANGGSEKGLVDGYSKKLVDTVSKNLPWAEVAQPVMAGGGSSYGYGGVETFGDGYTGFDGSVSADDEGRVDPEEVRSYFIGAIRNSQLNGKIPSDAAQFNIDGSPESWANFFVTLGYKESSFKTGTVGDQGRADIPSGSHGLYQLSPEDGQNKGYNPSGEAYTLEQLYDPQFNIDQTISIAEKLLSDDNIIAGGRTRGLSRYWGPLRRGDVKPPPVPASTPQPTISKPTQSAANAFSSGSCDGGFSVNSGVRIFCGSRNDIKAKMGKFESRVGDRKISLDFNAASASAKGFEVLIPSGASSDEENRATQYLQRLGQFFASHGVPRKNRGVKRKNFPSSNPVIFTEPFFNKDVAAINCVVQNIGEYNKILLETLGQIQGAVLMAPHENTSISTNVGGDRTGAVLRYNGETIGEREFAMRYIIRPLASGKVVTTRDAFGAVGNKHPEETRDEAFLSSIDISDTDIKKTVDFGKKIYEASELARTKPTTENVEAANSLREERDLFWANLEIDESDTEKKAEAQAKLDTYISNNNKDYTDKPENNKVNPASNSIAHTPYNNVSRGSFSTPDVGANVWVFFEGGDIDYPVVFANNPKPQDYAGVYDISSPSPDNPEPMEGDESNIYRGKTVINGRGGYAEIVDTTGRERYKIGSAHGGSYEMNQMGTTEFAVGGKTRLIKGDEFSTVRGDGSFFIQGDKELIVKGDVYNKFGNVKGDADISKRIKELHQPIHDTQQLFDLQRAGSGHELDTSPLQTQDGDTTDCPVCNGKNKFPTRTTTPSTFTPAMPNGAGGISESLSAGKSTVSETSEARENCFNCQGSGKVPWSAEGVFKRDPRKKEIPDMINANSDKMSELENRLSKGGNVTDYISRSHTIFVGSNMNDLNSIRVDPVGKRKLMGQMPSKSGKGVFPMYVPTPHVEPVATNSLSGGDYSMMVSNKYALFVGANGISQKTLGMFELQGRIMTISADQVNISSNNEVVLDGGKSLELTADVITIKPRVNLIGGESYKTVALDSSVAISSNMVVKGGIHNEGGMTTQHITAPLQYSETETTISYSDLPAGIIMGKDSMGGDVVSVAVSSLTNSSHSHTVATISSTLLDTNDDVRQCGAAAAGAEPILAPEVVHKKSRLRGKQTPIRYQDPNLFKLFEDCNENSSNFDKITDLIADPNTDIDDIMELLTRASDSELSVTKNSNCIPCE
jgi:hypothetical protein